MPEYEIKIVDSFTTERYAGNPCGVVTHAEGLTPEQMQAIAREMNLSETAFVNPSEVADVRVRFFTPRKEIPLAGHPTIATMHALVEEGRFEVAGEPRRIVQELNVGVLPVDLSRREDGHVRIAMTQATPEFHQELDPEAFARVLGIATADLREGAPPRVVSTGTRQAMIPVASLAVLERVRPDLERLAELETAEGYFSTHVFTLETYDPANRVHARHFGPSSGVWGGSRDGERDGRDGGLLVATRPRSRACVHGGAGAHHGAAGARRGGGGGRGGHAHDRAHRGHRRDRAAGDDHGLAHRRLLDALLRCPP